MNTTTQPPSDSKPQPDGPPKGPQGPAPGFAVVPSDFKPHIYAYVRSHIKNSGEVFSKYEQPETGNMGLKDLEAAIGDYYALEQQPKPSREDISYLVSKYNFGTEHEITPKEFKRFLKELAGFKKFDASTISRRRYKSHPGPYPGHPDYVDPYLIHNQSPHAVQLESIHTLPKDFKPTPFPLSRSAIHYSKAVFRNSHMNQHHHLYLPALEAAVKNVYAIDHQKTPSLDDIVFILTKHQFAVNREMTHKEFRRLLKELSGTKEYEKGSFGFVRKLPQHQG